MAFLQFVPWKTGDGGKREGKKPNQNENGLTSAGIMMCIRDMDRKIKV